VKTYEGYIAELEALKQILKGTIFYLALPAAFLPNAKAEDAYFYLVMPKGIKKITQQKWQEVAGKDDTETYALPALSPKMERLYFENSATYLSERKWRAITNAVSKHTVAARMNNEDQRLLQYMLQLPKNECSEFIQTVDSRRKANAELRRQYAELQARREAMENVGKRNSKAASNGIEPPADEMPEERVARISSMIASDFGESFEPFW